MASYGQKSAKVAFGEDRLIRRHGSVTSAASLGIIPERARRL